MLSVFNEGTKRFEENLFMLQLNLVLQTGSLSHIEALVLPVMR